MTDHWNWVTTVGAGLLLIALVLLLIAFRSRFYRLDPNLRSLRMGYPHRAVLETRFDVIDNIISALDENETLVRLKIRFLNAGAIMALLGLITVAMRSLYSLW